MRHKRCGFGNGKGINRFSGDNGSILLGPIQEFEAFVGRGRQGTFVAIVVAAATVHRAAFFRLGSGCNRVFLRGEMRHQITVIYYGKFIFRLGGNLAFILRPVHKNVASISRGHHPTGIALGKATATRCRAAFRKVNGHSDIIISCILTWCRRRFHGLEIAHRLLRASKLVPHYETIIIIRSFRQAVNNGHKLVLLFRGLHTSQVGHVFVLAHLHARLELPSKVNLPGKTGLGLGNGHLLVRDNGLLHVHFLVLVASRQASQHHEEQQDYVWFFHISGFKI